MAAAIAGDQWNEGDVSCSVVRRVLLADSFFATDGLFETTLNVLGDFGAYPAVIERELGRYLPFLATTKVLMAAVRKGIGREQAHEAIKETAVAAALAMREKAGDVDDLFAWLARDPRLGLDETELQEILAEPLDYVGAAIRQGGRFIKSVEQVVQDHPTAATYMPGAIL